MSKEAAQRAMREARYARRTSGAQPRLAVVKPGAELPVAPPIEQEPEVELCGHRSMNGRTCTRESGHAAKTHRYS